MANEAKQFTIGGVTHDVMDVGARQAIASLQNAIDAITSGDTTTAIKTFQEVIDFLDGVTDDATLIGKLNELRTLINAKYSKPASGIPASDLADGVIPDVSGFATKTEVNAKANSDDVVPNSRTVNGKALSSDVTIGMSDIQGLETAIGDAGKVKTVSVNGGPHSQPDAQGNVDVSVPSMTLDDVPTAGSNNAVKSGGVKQAIDEKLSNVTVNAIPANSVTLQATESNGVLSIFLADNTPILQLSDTELSIGASGGDFSLNGLYLQNDIEMAVTGDFSLSGTNVVEADGLYKILAANANSPNTVHVAYSGSSGSASGSIAITCGSISLSVSITANHILPSNYTLCDYIESTSTVNNTNYIDTNVPISSEIRVVAKIQNSKPSSIRFLYGARVYSQANILARVEGHSGSQGGTDVKNQRLIVSGSTFDESYKTDNASAHEFDVNKSRIIYDGQTYPASVVASNWSYPAVKLVICGYRYAEGSNSVVKAAENPILAKYYYFKIYDGDTLVRDYIPAKDNTTGKYGLYDFVNNTFSTSAGNVEFTGQVTT